MKEPLLFIPYGNGAINALVGDPAQSYRKMVEWKNNG